MSTANKIQVGGSHYKNGNLPDHWDVVIALGWDYLTGAATKYLWRLGKKGDSKQALQDIDKAIHYLQKKREVMNAELQARLHNPLEAIEEVGPFGYVDQG